MEGQQLQRDVQRGCMSINSSSRVMTSSGRSQLVFCIPSVSFFSFESLSTFFSLSTTIFLKILIMRKTLLLSLLATTASSQTPPLQDPSKVKDVVASAITSLFPTPGTLTSQILQTFLAPISTLLAGTHTSTATEQVCTSMVSDGLSAAQTSTGSDSTRTSNHQQENHITLHSKQVILPRDAQLRS